MSVREGLTHSITVRFITIFAMQGSSTIAHVKLGFFRSTPTNLASLMFAFSRSV